jgi:hypothetical protein
MKDAHRRRPEDFKRRILKRGIAKVDLFEEEHKWLSLIKKEELGKRYYNHSNKRFIHWSENQKKTTSMKERMLGEKNPAYGKPSSMRGRKHTEESRQKMRRSRAGQVYTEETKKKISESQSGEKNGFYGKKHSEEAKQIIAEYVKSRPPKKHTEESKQKMRELALERMTTPEGQAQMRAAIEGSLLARKIRKETRNVFCA